jgi:hypothetical protein
MARRAGIWIAALVVFSLAIGIFWTLRLAPPSPAPWWLGKDPEYHVEVWEPGKEMATVAATMPKKAVDAMFAFGLKSSVSAGDHKVYLNSIHKQVERLPRGQKLKIRDGDATIYVWLDLKK